MNFALLSQTYQIPSIAIQQKYILVYAHQNELIINTTQIENSNQSLELEKRSELKFFLRSLKKEDKVFVYNLATFSENLEEITKVLECLLKRSISIFLAENTTMINTKTPSLMLLELLLEHKNSNEQVQNKRFKGRPKGCISKSKFDESYSHILELLESNVSVSEISKILNVSRTSLRDYIHSRGLRDLIQTKLTLHHHTNKQNIIKPRTLKECSLITNLTPSTQGVIGAL